MHRVYLRFEFRKAASAMAVAVLRSWSEACDERTQTERLPGASWEALGDSETMRDECGATSSTLTARPRNERCRRAPKAAPLELTSSEMHLHCKFTRAAFLA
ncbi:hypothetical protein MTO96_015197 [Rhipicephalus appendiculatus]